MSLSRSVQKSSALTGIEKTAILLNVLGKEKSFEIMKQMSDPDIRKLLKIMGSMRRAPLAIINSVLREYLHKLSEKEELIFDENLSGPEAVKEGLGEDRAKGIFGSIKSVNLIERKQLSALDEIDAKALAEFLLEEHPQTTALIMAHLDVSRQISILKMLPEGVRPEVLQRMANLEYVVPERIDELNEMLRSELVSRGKAARKQFAGIAGVAELVNQLDNRTVTSLMGRLDEKDPVLAEEIRSRMFTFLDLVKLTARSMQMVMREVAQDRLLLAMKSAPDELREKVMSAMSERASKMFLEEVEMMGPQKVADVQGAQRDICAVVQRLQGEGRIEMNDGDASEFVP